MASFALDQNCQRAVAVLPVLLRLTKVNWCPRCFQSLRFTSSSAPWQLIIYLNESFYFYSTPFALCLRHRFSPCQTESSTPSSPVFPPELIGFQSNVFNHRFTSSLCLASQNDVGLCACLWGFLFLVHYNFISLFLFQYFN